MSSRAAVTLLVSLLTISCTLAGCFEEDKDETAQIVADFTFQPDENIKEKEEVDFDAQSSTPQDGTLTYRWDFNGDGENDATGRTPTWSYPIAGTYTVTLTATDGNMDDKKIVELTVLGADAAIPSADPGTAWAEKDCDDDDGSNPSNSKDRYLVYICEDKGDSDLEVTATTNIMLDSRDSTAGGEEAYLTEWYWDLDLTSDFDGDGITDNDQEKTGETHEWTNVAPGEYELSLTVHNSEGATDTESFKVYVNYVGIWEDFNQPGNTSATGNGQPGETWYEFDVIYEGDSVNTIVRAEFWLTYPKEDGDWAVGGGSEQNRNKLDVYIFNESDDEVWNTSSIPLEQRAHGDCSEDNDCIQTSISRSQMKEDRYGDGEWTVKVHNDRYNDIQVVEFRILLTYK